MVTSWSEAAICGSGLPYAFLCPTVEQLTGRPPATFRQWAETNAEQFQ
jgi:hypothetical protein